MNANSDIIWRVSQSQIAYPDALAQMESCNAAVQNGEQNELIWLLEHPPLYTAGTSSDPSELLSQDSRRPPYLSRAGAAGWLCHS